MPLSFNDVLMEQISETVVELDIENDVKQIVLDQKRRGFSTEEINEFMLRSYGLEVDSASYELEPSNTLDLTPSN